MVEGEWKVDVVMLMLAVVEIEMCMVRDVVGL